jgi:signal transduction histidine kinase
VALWQGRTTKTVPVGGTGSGPLLPAHRFNHNGPISQHGSDLRQLLVVSAIALGLMALVWIVFGWTVAGRFLRPMRAITTTAKEISATNLHERLNLTGPDDDLKELADTIDELLARLERSFEFERGFVANASHELRTPLATMRVLLDVAIAKPGPVPVETVTLADKLRPELDRIDRLLESFLSLAQSQQGPASDQSTVSLGAIASAAVTRRADAITDLGLRVEIEPSPPLLVRGSETLLARMTENVIDNAVDHNEPGGWVRVATEAEGHDVRLVVENGGPMLGQQDVDQLARPFRRLGQERTGSGRGTGLGLSIVQSIADVHGGTLDLVARGDGGLRVSITLPLAAQPVIGSHA